jgi:spermidine synthase
MALLGVAFCVSGGAGLLVEQSFEKLLGTLVGTSTPASAVVLAVYFGGLTLGGALYARRRASAKRDPTPALSFATYAVLEAIIGLAALFLAVFASQLVPVFVPLLRLGAGSGVGLLGVRLIVAACWILPLTVPMGATFAAVVDALDVVPERARGAAVSVFYGLNLTGAIMAAALGPYLVFPRAGVDGTLALAGLLDGGAALVAIESALAYRGAAPERSTPRAPGTRATDWELRRALPLLAIVAVSGFVLFSLEVSWTHLIGAVLGGSVYAFGTMLAVVLCGLGLGAVIGGVVGARLVRVPLMVPGIALVVAAITLLVGHGQWPDAPHALAVVGRDALTFGAAERARAATAVRLLLAPATALGAIYPLALRLEAFPTANAGSMAGRMGAANALASIAGALLTGFVGIPRFGSERVLLTLATACMVAGGLIMLASAKGRVARAAGVLACAGGALASLAMPSWNRLHLTSGEHVYFYRQSVYETTRLRFFHEDTRGGITTVVDNGGSGQHKVLLTNGKFQGADAGEMNAQDGFALAPMLFARHWGDALVIGLGTGRTAHVVSTMGFERVTIAEIAPGIVAAARAEFSHINGGVVERTNVRLVLEDARNVLLLDERTYDLITTEITSMWLAGATNLYSREFYVLARQRLQPGGVFQQWMQLHHVSIDDATTALATMRESFRYVSVFVIGNQGVFVGSDEPHLTQREFFERFQVHATELGDRDARGTVTRLHASRLLSPSDVDALVARDHPPINTDRNRRLEYTSARYNFDRTDRQPGNVRALAKGVTLAPQPVASGLEGELADAARAPDARAVSVAVGISVP